MPALLVDAPFAAAPRRRRRPLASLAPHLRAEQRHSRVDLAPPVDERARPPGGACPMRGASAPDALLRKQRREGVTPWRVTAAMTPGGGERHARAPRGTAPGSPRTPRRARRRALRTPGAPPRQGRRRRRGLCFFRRPALLPLLLEVAAKRRKSPRAHRPALNDLSVTRPRPTKASAESLTPRPKVSTTSNQAQ